MPTLHRPTAAQLDRLAVDIATPLSVAEARCFRSVLTAARQLSLDLLSHTPAGEQQGVMLASVESAAAQCRLAVARHGAPPAQPDADADQDAPSAQPDAEADPDADGEATAAPTEPADPIEAAAARFGAIVQRTTPPSAEHERALEYIGQAVERAKQAVADQSDGAGGD